MAPNVAKSGSRWLRWDWEYHRNWINSIRPKPGAAGLFIAGLSFRAMAENLGLNTNFGFVNETKELHGLAYILKARVVRTTGLWYLLTVLQ